MEATRFTAATPALPMWIPTYHNPLDMLSRVSPTLLRVQQTFHQAWQLISSFPHLIHRQMVVGSYDDIG